MKIKKIGLAFILFLLLFNITIFPTIQGESKNDGDKKSRLCFHLPIAIDGNYEFTKINGVRCGSGAREDPYIISDWKIYPIIKNGIQIRNTDMYFIIERMN